MADAADAAQAEQERLAEVMARFKSVEVVGDTAIDKIIAMITPSFFNKAI